MAKDRKNQIVRAAAKRFARHGLGKTTLDEIAGDVRIGKATIYHYFSSKENLYYKTLNWEIFQYITAIKAIFNNEDLAIGARLLEYFSYKENTEQRYKLLYDLMLLLLKDDSFYKEKNLLTKLLEQEEEIVRLILSSIFSERIESMDSSLPPYIVIKSWGLMFGNKINSVAKPDRVISMKEMMFKSIENILS